MTLVLLGRDRGSLPDKPSSHNSRQNGVIALHRAREEGAGLMDANDRRWAAHLLRRAGFGGTPEEIDSYAALGYEGAVERLLNPGGVDDSAMEAALHTQAQGLEPAELLADGQALWMWRMM